MTTEINTPSDFSRIADDLSETYILGGDVDFSSYDGSVGPIGKDEAFTGTFDGNGNTIKNVEISDSEGNGGLFGSVSGSIVDLTVENASMTYTLPETGDTIGAGILCGQVEEGSTVENISVEGEINLLFANGSPGGESGIGGVFGKCSADSLDTVEAEISLNVGFIDGGSASIGFDWGIGGVCGTASSDIVSCNSDTTVSFLSGDEFSYDNEMNNMGGVVGVTYGPINLTDVDSKLLMTGTGQIVEEGFYGPSVENSLDSLENTGGIVYTAEEQGGMEIKFENCSSNTIISTDYITTVVNLAGVLCEANGTTMDFVNCDSNVAIIGDGFEDSSVEGISGVYRESNDDVTLDGVNSNILIDVDGFDTIENISGACYGVGLDSTEINDISTNISVDAQSGSELVGIAGVIRDGGVEEFNMDNVTSIMDINANVSGTVESIDGISSGAIEGSTINGLKCSSNVDVVCGEFTGFRGVSSNVYSSEINRLTTDISLSVEQTDYSEMGSDRGAFNEVVNTTFDGVNTNYTLEIKGETDLFSSDGFARLCEDNCSFNNISHNSSIKLEGSSETKLRDATGFIKNIYNASISRGVFNTDVKFNTTVSGNDLRRYRSISKNFNNSSMEDVSISPTITISCPGSVDKTVAGINDCNSSEFNNVSVQSEVDIVSDDEVDEMSGFAVESKDCDFTDCEFAIDLNTESGTEMTDVGALVYDMSDTTIENCNVIGDVNITSNDESDEVTPFITVMDDCVVDGFNVDVDMECYFDNPEDSMGITFELADTEFSNSFLGGKRVFKAGNSVSRVSPNFISDDGSTISGVYAENEVDITCEGKITSIGFFGCNYDSYGGTEVAIDNVGVVSSDISIQAEDGIDSFSGLFHTPKEATESSIEKSYVSLDVDTSISSEFDIITLSGDITPTETYYENYWDSYETTKGSALTTDQITGESASTNLEGFDFNSPWRVTEDYAVISTYPELAPEITVLVRNSDTEPVEDQKIIINGKVAGNTDDEGFVTQEVPAGNDYQILWNNKGASKTVEGLETSKTITFTSLKIKGRVLNADSDPVEGDRIVISDTFVLETDENGRFESGEAPPVDLDLRWVGGGKEVNVEGRDGGVKYRKFEYAGIEVSVENPITSDPIQNSLVTIEGNSYTTDEEGEVENYNLKPGSYVVETMGYWREEVDEIDEGEIREVEFGDEQIQFTVNLEVLGPVENEPVEDIEAFITGTGVRGLTDSNGELTIHSDYEGEPPTLVIARNDKRFKTELQEIDVSNKENDFRIVLDKRVPMEK